MNSLLEHKQKLFDQLIDGKFAEGEETDMVEAVVDGVLTRNK
jgi:hypothetical protein